MSEPCVTSPWVVPISIFLMLTLGVSSLALGYTIGRSGRQTPDLKEK